MEDYLIFFKWKTDSKKKCNQKQLKVIKMVVALLGFHFGKSGYLLHWELVLQGGTLWSTMGGNYGTPTFPKAYETFPSTLELKNILCFTSRHHIPYDGDCSHWVSTLNYCRGPRSEHWSPQCKIGCFATIQEGLDLSSSVHRNDSLLKINKFKLI